MPDTAPALPEIPAIGADAYARIARAIRFLSENRARHPRLAEAAAAAGLSPFHFQRRFTQLAGVSPKAFLAHLTLEDAKRSLRAGTPVLEAAYGAGLSAPSRLYDLCLKIEAMTPGTYAKGGAGLSLAYGFAPTVFGPAILVATARGLCGLGFGEDEQSMRADMRARWPNAAFVADDAAIAPYAARIFSDRRGDLPVQLFGTPWQISVWQALLAIPEGGHTSYRAIAARMGKRSAARAVGAAVGKNPIALLIPCHRVLAANGALTGYHWGVARKRAILALEAARASDQTERPSTSSMA